MHNSVLKKILRYQLTKNIPVPKQTFPFLPFPFPSKPFTPKNSDTIGENIHIITKFRQTLAIVVNHTRCANGVEVVYVYTFAVGAFNAEDALLACFAVACV